MEIRSKLDDNIPRTGITNAFTESEETYKNKKVNHVMFPSDYADVDEYASMHGEVKPSYYLSEEELEIYRNL